MDRAVSLGGRELANNTEKATQVPAARPATPLKASAATGSLARPNPKLLAVARIKPRVTKGLRLPRRSEAKPRGIAPASE